MFQRLSGHNNPTGAQIELNQSRFLVGIYTINRRAVRHVAKALMTGIIMIHSRRQTLYQRQFRVRNVIPIIQRVIHLNITRQNNARLFHRTRGPAVVTCFPEESAATQGKIGKTNLNLGIIIVKSLILIIGNNDQILPWNQIYGAHLLGS